MTESELKDLIVQQASTIAKQTALLSRAREQLGSLATRLSQLEVAAVPTAPRPSHTVSVFDGEGA